MRGCPLKRRIPHFRTVVTWGNMGSKLSLPAGSLRRQDSGVHRGDAGKAALVGSTHQAPVTVESQQQPPGGAVGKMPMPASTATIRPVETALRASSALDIKITNALKELKRKQLQEDKDGANPFTKILLQLPLAAKSFNSVRSTFHAFEKDGKGYIVYADIGGAFERLGVNFSKEEIAQVFEESDMLENGHLNFKEFLVCLVIGFVLHKIPSLESERVSIFYASMPKGSEGGGDGTSAASPNQSLLFGEGNKLRIAFQLAVDAFLWFDGEGNGVLNRAEMTSRLDSSMVLHSPTKKTSSRKALSGPCKDASDESICSAIWEQRFAEMDWDHDGTIHFKEFLMAFESWVGFEDEDEEEMDKEDKEAEEKSGPQ